MPFPYDYDTIFDESYSKFDIVYFDGYEALCDVLASDISDNAGLISSPGKAVTITSTINTIASFTSKMNTTTNISSSIYNGVTLSSSMHQLCGR